MNPTHEVSTGSPVAQELYLQTYPYILDAILKTNVTLTIDEADVVMGAVARLLDRYDGGNDEDEFTAWAIGKVANPGAERLLRFHAMRQRYTPNVRKALWSVLKGCLDLGVHHAGEELGAGPGCVGTAAELEALVWADVLLDFDKWLQPGKPGAPSRRPARLATRLYAFARLKARAWKTAQIRSKRKYAPPEKVDQIAVAYLDRAWPRPRPVRLGPNDDLADSTEEKRDTSK